MFTVSGIVQKYNCGLKRLDFQQEQGYLSSLLLGHNGIEIQRGMTTSSTAIFVPFLTQELRMDGQAVVPENSDPFAACRPSEKHRLRVLSTCGQAVSAAKRESCNRKHSLLFALCKYLLPARGQNI